MNYEDTEAAGKEGTGGKNEAFKLAKVIGAFAIMASAVAQEYGAGINFVAVNALGPYPEIGNLVPLAMFVTGFLLLPKVYMYQRFGRVASRSGSAYVWIGRTLSPFVSFVVNFLWWVGVTAAMGFLAFTVGTTLAQTLVMLGLSAGVWFNTVVGHIVIGLIVIWLIFLLHYSGVRSYGIFVTVLIGLIILTAAIIIAVGFTTPSSAFTQAIQSKVTTTSTPAGPLTFGSFFGVMTLFVFAYGGLNAAPTLGGETKNASKNMPRGIVLAWVVAVILFSLVSLAIFMVAPSQDVIALIKSNQSYYATAPGIISLLTPKSLGLFVTVLVTIILAKTVAPEMLASSRLMFSWSEDGIFHRSLTKTNRFRAPYVSLLISAIIGSIFLIDSAVVGWSIGVILRAVSILVVIMFLGFGVIRSYLLKDREGWKKHIATPVMFIAAIAGIIVALVMIPTVLYKANTPLAFEPWFQLIVGVIISVIIYAYAYARMRSKGRNLEKELLSKLPLE